MVNGYVFVDLLGANVYKKALGAIRAKKPVLVKDYDQIYYADNITTKTVDGDLVVVITKGGKTIEINDANAVSSTGEIIANIMENIVDLAGNKRFIEGTCKITEISGMTISYNKWSLSGSHLMIVIAGNVENTSVLSSRLATLDTLPKYVSDRIRPIYGSFVDRKNIFYYADDNSSQSVEMGFVKVGDVIAIQYNGSLTLTADRSFRLQFDLLIDADYSE